MNTGTIYFAYGSNLHEPQMRERCPDCAVLQPAVLADYRLSFRGHSQRWGGGAASIDPAPGVQVSGLLYRLSDTDLHALNGFEGYPATYAHLTVPVVTTDGARVEALTYRRNEGPLRPPSLLYFHQIWSAGKRLGLDESTLLAAVSEALAAVDGAGSPTGGHPR